MKQEIDKLSKLYNFRFPEEELAFREELWKVLVSGFLQKYVKKTAVVLDLGGGLCSFINNICAGKKYVVDLNPDLHNYAQKDVITIQEPADNIASLSDQSIDVVFVSNFFEHMKDKDELDRVMTEINRILAVNGSLLIIQPNIRYAYREYWDAIDHYIPLSDRSLIDSLVINNFEVTTCYPRFLPWSPKSSRLTRIIFLLKLYLRIPLLWRFFGKQLFIEARKLP